MKRLLKSIANSLALSAMLLVVGAVSAQSTFATLGGDITGATGSVSYTVGQMETQSATGRVTNSERRVASLNEGVQQTYTVEELKIDGVQVLADVKIYPNPTTDKITVVAAQGQERLEYQLFDINGRQLDSGTIDGDETDINMKEYAAGSYVLRINGNGAENSYRITKIR